MPVYDISFPPLVDRDLLFVDTEATGLEFKHEIIEIGFVKAKAKTFELIAEGDIKIKPEHIENASPDALLLNGYDPAEWAREGVLREEGIRQFLSYSKDSVLVGHGIVFDWARLFKTIYEVGLSPNYFYKGIDTFSIAWPKFKNNPAFKNVSLRELADYFGIERGRAHRAIDDARTTHKVFLRLLEI